MGHRRRRNDRGAWEPHRRCSFDARPRDSDRCRARAPRAGSGPWAVTAAGTVIAAHGAVTYRGERARAPSSASPRRPTAAATGWPTARVTVFAFGDAIGRVPAEREADRDDCRRDRARPPTAAATGSSAATGLSSRSETPAPTARRSGTLLPVREAPTPPRPDRPSASSRARGRTEGYWIFGTTGRVVNRGSAPGYGGDNNLALATQ